MLQLTIPEEKSKFQLHSETMVQFLNEQRIIEPGTMKKIYLHQIEAVFAVKEFFSASSDRVRPALVVAPTGAGKTGIVALLPYVLASAKVMILSPSLIITKQLEMAFGLRNDCATESFYFQRGIVTESQLNSLLEKGKKIDKTEAIYNMKKHNLVIVNAQKFGPNSSASLNEPKDYDDEDVGTQIIKTKENFASFTTLIVDEAHHYPAETWDMICQEFKGKQIIFLTATPFRGSDRKELWEGQKITYNISKKTLIDMKVIRPLRYENIAYDGIPRASLDDIPFDRVEDSIYQILHEHDEMEPSVQHKAMVLVSNKDIAEEGARFIKGATFFTSDKKTERNLKKFEDSKFPNDRVIFVCGSLLEGYDNPDVSLCVILRNVGSLGLFTQFVGRCIRMSKTLPDGRIDSVTAVVASLSYFNQKRNFDDYVTN